MTEREDEMSLRQPGSAGEDEDLDGVDQNSRSGWAGVDLAEDLPGLELCVRALAGPALAGVGGVDLLLRLRQLPVMAGVGIEPAPPLRHSDGRSAALGNGPAPRRSEQKDRLGTEWETHRPAVFGVAYRLLGGVADAEDVAQDVWLRAAGADLRGVDDLRAWLVTVAARRSYDILKSARLRREAYVGPWLPEPLLTGPDASEPVLVDESVSAALLLVMEELAPPERVAFVLHDVFGFEFGRIAEVLDVSVPAARQLASRARRRVVKAKQSTPQAPKAERERVLTTFRAAYEAGDLAGLVRLLHPDAVYVTDGGGKVSAARKLIHGGQRVADVMVRVGRQWRPDHIDLIEVGGDLALAFYRQGRVHSVDTVQITDGLITAYRRVINPDKLSHV